MLTNLSTTAWAPFGLTKCFDLAMQYRGTNEWVTTKPEQKTYFDLLFKQIQKLLSLIPEDQLRSCVADNAEEINVFLRRYGTGEIQLSHWDDPDTMGFAAITHIPMPWLQPGEEDTIKTLDGKSYTAVKMKQNIQFFKTPKVKTIVAIKGEDQHYICMTPYQEIFRSKIQTGMSLVQLCRELSRASTPITTDYDAVKFPMISMKFKPDLSWVKGLNHCNRTTNVSSFIVQAIQLIMFQMNHLGAVFHDEVAMTDCLNCIDRDNEYILDKPFLCWMGRGGLDAYPLFAAVLTEDCWKDPGTIL